MRILMPTDGSEFSKEAARYMRRLGIGPDDEIILLHVLKDFLMPDTVHAAKDFRLSGEQGAVRMLEDFRVDALPPGVRVKTVVRDGEPSSEIVAAASELEAGLVVMGHKGLSTIKEYLLGSTVRGVVRDSTVSVLVVRKPFPEGRPPRVLFCADGTASSAAARELLCELPFAGNTAVDVLSVVDMDVTSMPEKFYPEEDLSRMMAELREHYRESAQHALDADTVELAARFADITQLIRFGAPDEEITRTADELGTDLIVVGCKPIRSIPDRIVGSESLRVLRHADCNLLIAKIEGC